MLAKFHSAALSGVDASVVEIELDLAPGLPQLRLVGLPDKSVQEAADRVQSALRNSGYSWPTQKIVVNLAPAELPKEGAFYDLPIALAALVATGQIPGPPPETRLLVLGELALDGSLRPVRGVLAATITARQLDYDGVVVPRANAAEARPAAAGMKVVAVGHLKEAVAYFAGERPETDDADEEAVAGAAAVPGEPSRDFGEVRGQAHVKRAFEVAAAGGHNVLMLGPPGSGKTMCAQRLPSILPPLTFAESLETTKIWSVAGELRPGDGLMKTRPFRNPHHNASVPAMVGGGALVRPGEVSLAHNGVLFLDEAPEFARPILEALRQPLEDGRVMIGRASGTRTFPARIMLVMAANLCPCGRRGDPRKTCRCTPLQVTQYLGRLSGPLLDRIDLHVEVPPVEYAELRSPLKTGEPSSAIRARVETARTRQLERYGPRPTPTNAAMTPTDLERYATLDRAGEDVLRLAMNRLGLSARAMTRMLKVARTVADLAGSEAIAPAHLAEAVQYRTMDRKA